MSTDQVTVTTFGYLHNTPPPAHLTIDLRAHFRDPHINPRLRYMTAHDPEVRDTVLSTSGIPALIDAAAAAVHAYLAGPSAGPVTIAIGCAGGRHRAATVGEALAELLAEESLDVEVAHRDLDKPVVHR